MTQQRQNKNQEKPKVRFNGWLTEDNYDFLCKLGREEDRSMANVLNRIISSLRRQAEGQ